MRWVWLMAGVAILAWAGSPAGAQTAAMPPADPCALPDNLVMDDSGLPRVVARLGKGEPLRIIVLGSASSTGMGTSGPAMAYPMRLESELRHRLGRTDVTVSTLARQGLTAAEMAGLLEREVIARRPTLVVWQTGTIEARRGLPLRDFGAVVSDGINRLHAQHIDVALMDMQFSPKLSSMFDYGAYQDFLQQISDRFDVILIRRYDMMQYWNETGAIPLEPADKAEQIKAADLVHACVARHLARMIVDGLRPPASTPGK